MITPIIAGETELRNDSLSVIPLGGQNELGRMLWVLAYGGEMILIDAGASYPSTDMPGVDLLLPNTNFLEANKDRIRALLLTNGHEEHCGAVSYLLRHLPIPKILAPRFVSAFLSQSEEFGASLQAVPKTQIDTVETRKRYEIGPFEAEWIRVNDAIADACALTINTPLGEVVYTSSFKLDQTPVDRRLLDASRLAEIGDKGCLLLISASAGVEGDGYTESERRVIPQLERLMTKATGRVFVLMPGTNTPRLQILFDLAKRFNRKVLLSGDVLIRTGVAAAITGYLEYDRRLEAHLNDLKNLPDHELLIVATGHDGDAMAVFSELANGTHKELQVKSGDVVIYSADVIPGRARQMAMILDQLLAQGVTTIQGNRQRVHVPKHASREELKLMLSLTNPLYFVPTFGEGRHIMHHAQLAMEWGLPPESVFPLKNGDVLCIDETYAEVTNSVEAQAVLVNRDQGERVTTFSVNERRVLSMEGIVTISFLVDETGEIINGPMIEAGAAAFLSSREWQDAKSELQETLVLAHSKALAALRIKNGNKKEPFDINQLRSSLREAALKTIRSKLRAKPTVQVMLQTPALTKPFRQ